MPNITRGGRMLGLMAYLVGPGKDGNEVHTEPHVVKLGQRFKALPELDRAARRWALVLLDPPPGGLDAIWAAIGARVSRDELQAASEAIGRLTPPELGSGGQDAAFRAERLRRYPSLRRFLPALLEVVPFDATRAGRPVLDALDALRSIEGRPGRVTAASVPLELVGGPWKRLVLANPQLGDGELDRRAYSFCVLEALQRALDRRDVFVARSGRFTDPRAKLLSGPARAPAASRPRQRAERVLTGPRSPSGSERAFGPPSPIDSGGIRQTRIRVLRQHRAHRPRRSCRRGVTRVRIPTTSHNARYRALESSGRPLLSSDSRMILAWRG